MKNDGQKAVRLPSFFEAILPIITMVALMVYVFKFSDEAYDAAHMPLIIALIVTVTIGVICGHTFEEMLSGIIDRITATLDAILILLTVGLLVSSFMISGTIPALIYYGLWLYITTNIPTSWLLTLCSSWLCMWFILDCNSNCRYCIYDNWYWSWN